MKTETKTILPLATLAILMFALSPLAGASTLTVNLNPKTGIAKVDSVSTTKITFTYPVNSTVSKYLRNVSSTFGMSGKFDGSSQGTHELQGSFEDWDHHVQVSNMSVAVRYSAKGNATALVIAKSTDVNATVTGVFQVVNGTVHADLGWRAFIIKGAFDLPMDGHMVDVNLAGSAMEDSLGSHADGAAWMLNAFGGGSFWNRPTLNFSALNAPLSTWTKNYDSATNTTTFTKTISGQDTFSVTANFNGQKYSLSSVSDPSGTVSVAGYANASGDSLVIAPAPASTSGTIAAVAVTALLVIAAGYFLLRRTTNKPKAATQTPLPV